MSRIWSENLLPPKDGGQHILLASTIYDRPDVCFLHSALHSVLPLYELGIGVSTIFVEGNCHVDDARNSVVAHFLESECTDLMFLDADVTWHPDDLLKVILADTDIAGGVYPHRREWSFEHRTEMPVRLRPDGDDVDAGGLKPVDGLPTGFMKIRRRVLEALADAAPMAITAKGEALNLVFERRIFEGRRMSGDIAFCVAAIERGFSVCALPELNLGHRASSIVRDSLGAMLRRRYGSTLAYVAGAIRNGELSAALMQEARRSVHNPFAMDDGGLLTCAALARKAKGPILEAGSGISSVMMAAANPKNTVWCLEQDRRYKDDTFDLAREAGVSNIAVVTCEMRDGWYDIIDPIPDTFAVGVVDGPVRPVGNRQKFFNVYGDKCADIVVDDVDEKPYAEFVEQWAKSVGRPFYKLDDRVALVMEEAA